MVGVIMQFLPFKLYCPSAELPVIQLSSPSGFRRYDLSNPGPSLYAYESMREAFVAVGGKELSNSRMVSGDDLFKFRWEEKTRHEFGYRCVS